MGIAHHKTGHITTLHRPWARADTNGTDLSKYKIIKKNDFAVSLMQVSRDSKIPVARLEEYDVAIMSPAYPIFRVKDENVILPEYLDMWFKRPEFDREAAFIAVGGVRGSMPWEDFANMKNWFKQDFDYDNLVSVGGEYAAYNYNGAKYTYWSYSNRF